MFLTCCDDFSRFGRLERLKEARGFLLNIFRFVSRNKGPLFSALFSGELAKVYGEFTLLCGEFTLLCGEFTLLCGELAKVYGEFTLLSLRPLFCAVSALFCGELALLSLRPLFCAVSALFSVALTSSTLTCAFAISLLKSLLRIPKFQMFF